MKETAYAITRRTDRVKGEIVKSVPSDGRRGRAREYAVIPGVLSAGPVNGLTDVPGVCVGHRTLLGEDDIRTGVTAVLPHGGSLLCDRVPAGIAVANGYGKLMGMTQVTELGELETPIVLTNTLSVPQAADALIEWTLTHNEGKRVRSINPVVGETNDGRLNAIEKRAIRAEHVMEALEGASSHPPEEGNVGAGTGTVAFGWKGGIGTSSRRLPEQLGGTTVGVLVQSNFGGILQVLGVPLGRLLDRYYLKSELVGASADGSIMIVLATDAPLSDRNLTRLARRAFAGLARTGASFVNGSGDYAIAFSTAIEVRRTPDRRRTAAAVLDLPNDAMSPLFQAAIEATEEAIYNSLFAAETMTGREGTVVEALPIDRVLALLHQHHAIV